MQNTAAVVGCAERENHSPEHVLLDLGDVDRWKRRGLALGHLPHEFRHCAILVLVAKGAAGNGHGNYNTVVESLNEGQAPLVCQPEQYEYAGPLQFWKNREPHEHFLGPRPGKALRTNLALGMTVHDAEDEAGYLYMYT